MSARSRSVSRAASGFSLLEVMLAMLLSTVLLAGLWAAMTIHVRMFDAGRTDVEQAQLARALLQQIAADLRNAQVTPSGAATSASSPLEPGWSLFSDDALGVAGVDETADTVEVSSSSTTSSSGSGKSFECVGRRNYLRLDICDGVPPGARPMGPPGYEDPHQDESELRTVEYYLFDEEAGMPLGGESEVTRGLVRRIDRWAALVEEAASDAFGEPNEPNAGEGQSVLALRSRDQFDSLTDEDALAGDAMIVIPEVIEVVFRYFDGAGWTEEWSSSARGTLPVAVEISLTVEPPARRRGSRMRSDEEERPVSLLDEEDLPVYRLVVQLPRAKRVEATSSSDESLFGGEFFPSGFGDLP